MDHDDFLLALRCLMEAYARLDAALVAAAPPSIAPVLHMDALSRAQGEEFGHPVVQWFRRGSMHRGIRVDDGTLILPPAAVASGPVLFLAGVGAEDDAGLPQDWPDSATEVGTVEDGVLTLGGAPRP